MKNLLSKFTLIATGLTLCFTILVLSKSDEKLLLISQNINESSLTSTSIESCIGSGNPEEVCICYYDTFCVYVTKTSTCNDGSAPFCP